jgi:hypothetical protein
LVKIFKLKFLIERLVLVGDRGMSAEETVRSYKRLTQVERVFRSFKTMDLRDPAHPPPAQKTGPRPHLLEPALLLRPVAHAPGSIDTVFDYKQVFKDYCINDDRWPPQQQNGSGFIYSKAVRRQPEQSHQSQVESIVQATRSTVVTTVSFVLDKVSGF